MGATPSGGWAPSPMQLGMLLEEARGADQASRVEQLVFRFQEPVDGPRLREAWQHLIARHASLRAVFDLSQLDRAVRFVDQVVLPWQEQDLRSLTPPAAEDRWEAWLRHDREQGFDLAAPPLLRAGLFRFAEGETRLVFSFHHLLLDGRSLPLLLKELSALYDGNDLRVALHPGPDFSRFLAWRAQWETEHEDVTANFWKQRLAGFSQPVTLQLPEPEDGLLPLGPHSIPATLEDEATATLRAAAEQAGVGLAAVIQAAWALVLSAYSGQTDLVFGILRHGRRGHLPEADQTLGVFANMLPLRVRVDTTAPVRNLLHAIQQESRDMRAYEQTPLATIRAQAEIEGGRPLFESLVAFESYDPDQELRRAFGDRETRHVELLEGAPMALTVGVHLGETLRIRLGYHPERFRERNVRQLTEDFVAVLRRLPGGLNTPLAHFPVPATDHAARLQEWSRGPAMPAGSRLLHEWFEATADHNPAAIAVYEGTAEVSYGRLEREANQLAHALRAEGAAPDDRVALCMPRSATCVAAILGILKSGAAYLPLDPDLPAARLAQVAAEAEARWVVTLRATSGQLPPGGFRVLYWEELRSGSPPGSDARLPNTAGPDNLCYVIATSGSTGTPKLVGVEHRSVDNLLHYAARELLTPDDVRCVPFTDSLAADACVHQIFAVLALGGSLVVVENPLEFAQSPFYSRFTYLGTTPSLLATLLATGGLPESVRTIGLGAEAIPGSVLETLATREHVRQVLNFYGPTEATIYCTVQRVYDRRDGREPEASDAPARTGRTIGRPIGNCVAAVLDAALRPVPEGVPGELYVGGPGVARGYLGQPELTAERFITRLSGRSPEERFYRTGDMVRWLPSGCLEFLGRLDQQIKIRGYRVEPGEIEAVLRRSADIREAVVVLRKDDDREPYLAAYVVSTSGGAVDGESHLRRLREALPEPMIPQRLVQLPALPLTASGKLDRAALPEPPRPVEEEETAAEANPLYACVRQAWAEVLGVSPAGLHDDFFDLGGHSLAALRLAARLSDLAAVSIPVSQIFQLRTPHRLAEALLLAWLDDAERFTDEP